MAFLPLLVAIGLAVGRGRCQNTCSISWGVDTSLASWVPKCNPDAEETCLRGEMRFQMLRLPVVLVILHPNVRAMSHVQDRIYYEGEDDFLSRHGLQPYLLRRLSGRKALLQKSGAQSVPLFLRIRSRFG